MRPPTTIISPWLSRHRGRVLPAIHHTEGTGPFLDVALATPARGNLICRAFKDPELDNRLAMRQLLDADQGGPSVHTPPRFCKNPDSNNRVMLRAQACEVGVDPGDAIRKRGGLWKEGRLFSSSVASSASTSVFVMDDDAESLDWFTNDIANPPPILEDAFAGYFVEWLTGDNAGLFSAVSASDGSEFTLASAMPNAIQAGDTFALRRTMRNRVHGRVFRRPRVQAYWRTGDANTSGVRVKKYMPSQLEIRFLSLNVLDRDENVALYAPFNWFTFETWAEVKTILDFGDPTNNVLRPIELVPSYFDFLMGKRLFVRNHAPLVSGVNGDGYVRHAGSFGNAYDNDSAYPGAFDVSKAVILGRNTVFDDTPQIPLPITYYLQGVYINVEHFMVSNTSEDDVTGVQPLIQIGWVLRAIDGDGNILFDPAISPYSDKLFDWWFNESFDIRLPGLFKLYLDWGYMDWSTAYGVPSNNGRQSPLVVGGSVNPATAISALPGLGLVTVNPYVSECAHWGGPFKSDDAWKASPGQFPHYELRVDIDL